MDLDCDTDVGEIMLWAGLYVTSTNTMKGIEYASIISPLFSAYLLTRVTGVPLLERASDKKVRARDFP